MTSVVVLGAGMMGYGLAFDLAKFGCLEKLTIADLNFDAAKQITKEIGHTAHAVKCNVQNTQQLYDTLSGHDTAISALPYHFNFAMAKACVKMGLNMTDLGGNTEIVYQELSLNPKAVEKDVIIIPDLGLAPGMMTILTMGLCNHFAEIDHVKIRVGGLPQKKAPPLDYQLTFNPEGLINEYREPCWVIRDYARKTVKPLIELEKITFPKPFGELEAFNTSGGTSSLPLTLEGKVKELDYKTIRFPGHCEKVRLLAAMGLFEEEIIEIDGLKVRPRDIFSQLLLKKLPKNEPDVVLARASVTGRTLDNEYCTIENEIIDYFDPATKLTAMMRTTAFPTSIVALMMTTGQITTKGAISAENAVKATEMKKELKRRKIIVKKAVRVHES
ncbi:MAG: saccharopine dehydrogenase family protein [Candidatus Hodarchaeota archaeon]